MSSVLDEVLNHAFMLGVIACCLAGMRNILADPSLVQDSEGVVKEQFLWLAVGFMLMLSFLVLVFSQYFLGDWLMGQEC